MFIVTKIVVVVYFFVNLEMLMMMVAFILCRLLAYKMSLIFHSHLLCVTYKKKTGIASRVEILNAV